VIEDGLREGLAGGMRAEVSVETEGFHDGQVGLDGEERSSWTLLLVEDVTSSSGEDTVDTTHCLLGHLNLDKEDGLEETRLGEEGRGVQDTTGSWDDLSTTTVDSISVEGDIQDVEAARSHWLFSDWSFSRGPLETGDDRVLDFVQVLDGLGLVDQHVGTAGVGTEAPDLSGIGNVPPEVVSQDTGTSLEIVTRADLAVLNLLRDLLGEGLGNHVETVVLVGRLRQSGHAGLRGDSLTVRNDGVGDAEGNTSMVLLEILQADFQVQLTSTGNDVLTGLGDLGQDAGVGFRETLETFDQLGQILGVLHFDGSPHDGRDGELHDLQVVGGLAGGEGTRLQQELIDTDQSENVTGWDIIDRVDLAAHHEDGTLDGLDEEIILLARGVVGALDADLQAGADSTGEDTTESVETTLVRGWHHLGDVQHEGSLGVTLADTNAGLIIRGTLVQGLGTVLLGRDGRWQVQDHHLHKRISRRQEGSHDNLEQLLALLVLVLGRELDGELLEEDRDLVLLEVHDGGEDLEDGVEDELVEGTLQGLALVGALVGPLLGVGVEVVVAPETLHHLIPVDTELLGISLSELSHGEGPAVETGTEGHGPLVWVDLDITEDLVEVRRDDDVDRLDGSGEGLVQILLRHLELEKGTVDLVDDDDGLDTLTKRLSEHGLGLHADTLDGVDDDERAVRDTESSSDLGREINVAGRVDQVDQEVAAVGLLADDVLEILVVGQVPVQGDGGRLDCDASLLLVLAGVGGPRIASLRGGDNAGLREEGVGQRRLAVVDVGDDGHVTDVRRLVHQGADLFDGEAAFAHTVSQRSRGYLRAMRSELLAGPSLELWETAETLDRISSTRREAARGGMDSTHLTMVGDRAQKADKSRVLGSDAEAWDSGLERGVKVHRSRRGAVSICGCLGMNQDRRDRGSQRKWWRFSVDGERETMAEGKEEQAGEGRINK
jgi:hypothetical protein